MSEEQGEAKKSADIEVLPGRKWNAHAALAYAMNRAPMNAPLLVLWLDEDGDVRHAATTTNQEAVWMAQVAIHRSMNGW
jgi:hypothetical protein